MKVMSAVFLAFLGGAAGGTAVVPALWPDASLLWTGILAVACGILSIPAGVQVGRFFGRNN